jgi:hypothetical protein
MRVFFFPKLSLSVTSFRPSAAEVLSVKSGALVPTGMGMMEEVVARGCGLETVADGSDPWESAQ